MTDYGRHQRHGPRRDREPQQPCFICGAPIGVRGSTKGFRAHRQCWLDASDAAYTDQLVAEFVQVMNR